MADHDFTGGGGRTITAFFDTQASADAASADLVAAGVAPSRVTVRGGPDDAEPAPEKGFWESLKELFLPDEDRHAYAEGLRRGGYVISVEPQDHEYDRVLDILDRDGAVDLDERAAEWRGQGWSGTSSGLAGIPLAAAMAPSAAADADAAREEQAQIAAADSASVAAAEAARSASGGGESISSYGEPSRVGRRETDIGRARVRSYVAESSAAQPLRDEAQPASGAEGESRLAAARSSRISAHMDVIGDDGIKIGEVDHLEGDRMIKLTKDASPDDRHHFVPIAWVDHVDAHVHLNRSSADARLGW